MSVMLATVDDRCHQLFLPMRGYEPDSIDNIDKPLVLFLPMRGYEIRRAGCRSRNIRVISPHEGL